MNDEFGDFIIIEILTGNKNRVMYKLKCKICGRTKDVYEYIIKQNRIGTSHSSCGKGIRNKDKKFYTHWKNMRTRTCNENYERFDRYGGRNINSDAFENFIDFYDTMYKSYLDHVKIHGENNTTLERIDYDKNYSPSNCKWATWQEQQSNTSKNRLFKAISPEGEEYISKNQSDFARKHKLSDKQINACLKNRFKTHKGWKFQYVQEV
jgi:hypothetical protein